MSGGGGSSSDGSNDMQVSGAEAAYSKEKGISTHSDTRVSRDSFSQPSGGADRHPGTGISVDKGGVHDTGPVMGADRSTVGIAAPDPHSPSEIEKGYTDDGEKLSNVNGVYMTKSEMYNTGIVEKDPTTGEEVMGRNTINPNTGELERTDLSFAEHWANAPDALKYSPTMRFLYASGKNISEYSNKKGFKGYNEAGLRGTLGNATTDDSDGSGNLQNTLTRDGDESDRMNTVAPDAPFIISGTTKPDSVAAKFFGNTANKFKFSFENEYAAAKARQKTLLGSPSSVGLLAVNQSPFYNWLKDKSLNKGIL